MTRLSQVNVRCEMKVIAPQHDNQKPTGEQGSPGQLCKLSAPFRFAKGFGRINSVISFILCLGALILASAKGSSSSDFVFVSVAGEKKIVAYGQDQQNGSLSKIDEIKTTAEPGFLCSNKRGTRLFAAFRSSGELASFQIDTSSGKLTLVSQQMGGADPAYFALDRSETFLLSAYYQAGKVGSHRLGQHGAILEPIQWLRTNLKAHAILTDPSNRWALVPHTRPNAIYVFSFDASTGKLLRGAPPLHYTGSHSGPRHLQFHPSLDRVYVDNEQASSVSVFRFDTGVGQLSHLQTLPSIPNEPRRKNSCADMELTPDGRFLYVSNRGHDSLAGFKVLAENGKLELLGYFPTEATPRSFSISPSGKWLTTAGEASEHLQVHAIAPTDGQLTSTQRIQSGSRPWAVLAVSPLSH